MHSKAVTRTLWLFTVCAGWVLSAVSRPAWAAVPGFTEDFTVDSGSFLSQADVEHVASGGVGGAADGYITATRTKPDHLGMTGTGVEFTGNLVASGVTGFSFWLNDVGANDPLGIHVGVGRSFSNFWLYTPTIFPPENAWGQFSVDFSNPADWIQIRGSGTFQQALMTSDRLLIRHDQAPFEWFPDAIAGDFGLDRVTVLPEPGPMELLLVVGLLMLRRRPSTELRMEN